MTAMRDPLDTFSFRLSNGKEYKVFASKFLASRNREIILDRTRSEVVMIFRRLALPARCKDDNPLAILTFAGDDMHYESLDGLLDLLRGWAFGEEFAGREGTTGCGFPEIIN